MNYEPKIHTMNTCIQLETEKIHAGRVKVFRWPLFLVLPFSANLKFMGVNRIYNLKEKGRDNQNSQKPKTSSTSNNCWVTRTSKTLSDTPTGQLPTRRKIHLQGHQKP